MTVALITGATGQETNLIWWTLNLFDVNGGSFRVYVRNSSADDRVRAL
jgi:hypothetical protein